MLGTILHVLATVHFLLFQLPCIDINCVFLDKPFIIICFLFNPLLLLSELKAVQAPRSIRSEKIIQQKPLMRILDV